MKVTNIHSLRRLVNKWAERLRLQDWEIIVRWNTKEEAEEVWGTCSPDLPTKRATIAIARARHCVPTDEGETQDVEVTVVHELLHLHFAVFKTRTGSALEILEENAVHILSKLLVALDRQDETLLDKPLSKIAALNASAQIA